MDREDMINGKLSTIIVVGFILLNGISAVAFSENKQTIDENKTQILQDEVVSRGFVIGIVWGRYTYLEEWYEGYQLECNQGELKVLGFFGDVRPWLEKRAMFAELLYFKGIAKNGFIFGIALNGGLHWIEYSTKNIR